MSVQQLFVWAQLRIARNRLRRQIARLRSPRYAIALVIGIAYFYFIFFSRALDDGDGGPATVGIDLSAPESQVLFAMGLAALSLWWWVRGGYESALAFTPAEVHFLFTAPLRRRHLIQFKLLRRQLPLVFSAFLFSLIFSRTPLPFALRFVSLWLLISTIQLHQLGASLVRVGAEQRGGRRSRLLPIVIAVGYFVALFASVGDVLPEIRAAGNPAQAIDRMLHALSAPLPSALLLPFEIALGPTVARTVQAWLLALPGALVLLVLHYVWLLRTDASFEEAAAEAGAKQAARVAAVRAGRLAPVSATARKVATRRSWVPLAPHGPPAVALAWKNVVTFVRGLRGTSVAVFGGVLVVLFALIAAASGSVARAADILVIMSAAYSALFIALGPLTVRNDLRSDLPKIEVLKTLPLRGRDLVAAEIAASTVTLAALQVLLLLFALALAPLGERSSGFVPELYALVCVAIVALPAINALMLSLHNGFALLFPAWSRLGADQPGGAEFMGQFIVTALGSVMAFAVALLPPLVFAAFVHASSQPFYGRFSLAPAAVGFLLAIWAEVLLLVGWLGRLFDRLEATDLEPA